jgi:hypothetical protein
MLYVPASLIAKQAICEYMAFLEARSLSRPRPGAGRLVARRVALREGRGRAARVSAAGEIMGVPVAASPDLALLDGEGRVAYLVKASVRGRPAVYRSDLVYLYVAALLLDGEGALAATSYLAVVSASREDLLRPLLERASEEGRLAPARGDGYLVYVEVYDRERALSLVAPLLEPWRGLRPPRPSPSPGKCSVCRFSGSCEFSQARG